MAVAFGCPPNARELVRWVDLTDFSGAIWRAWNASA